MLRNCRFTILRNMEFKRSERINIVEVHGDRGKENEWPWNQKELSYETISSGVNVLGIVAARLIVGFPHKPNRICHKTKNLMNGIKFSPL